MRRHIVRLLAAVFVALAALPSGAQQFTFESSGARPLNPEDAFRIELRETRDGRAEIAWRITDGYYLYRDHISAETASGLPLEVVTPSGVMKEDPNFGAVEVYYEDVAIVLPQAGGDVRVTWQGCQEDGICYAPATSELTLPAVATEPATADAGPEPASATPQFETQGGMVSDLASRGGTALVLLAFFGFGIALALTPCVFPMIPILAGMLARQGEALTPARGAMLSGAYVLAMASAFGLLGAVAGWSGQNLQMVLQSPWAIGSIVVLFVVLALSSFGFFELQLPARLTQSVSAGQGRRGSAIGAMALGFTSALIVGPCVTAPLAGAFLYIAQTGDTLLGAAALFFLGLGQGVPLIAVGIFGARVLPRAGTWMQTARNVFGILFLGLAIWLAGRLLPGPVVLLLWAVLLTGCAVFLGAIDKLDPNSSSSLGLQRTAGIVFLFGGALLGLGAAIGAQDPLRPLAPLVSRSGSDEVEELAFSTIGDAQGLSAALSSDPARPSMIYVTADWCITCKGIERSVLPDPAVAAALEGLRLVKMDVTQPDEKGQALLDRLGAAGPPTMIFLDADLKEPARSRLVGQIDVPDIVRARAALEPGAEG